MTHSFSGNPVRLLWTGGWDSTFRLLQLVQTTTVVIEPVYVIDTGRRSTLREIEAMGRIKRMIVSRYAGAEKRILPHRFCSIHDIAEDQTIIESWWRIKGRCHIGTQYDWLARLAKQEELYGIELCLQARAHDDEPGRVWSPRKSNTLLRRDDLVGNYRVIDAVMSDRYTLFQCFRFPLLDITKLEMSDHMLSQGCLDIMMETVFCFAPINGAPCGRCNPCQIVIKEGLGGRMPRATMRRHYLLRLRTAPKRIAKRILMPKKTFQECL